MCGVEISMQRLTSWVKYHGLPMIESNTMGCGRGWNRCKPLRVLSNKPNNESAESMTNSWRISMMLGKGRQNGHDDRSTPTHFGKLRPSYLEFLNIKKIHAHRY
jgi:hypothetical protein